MSYGNGGKRLRQGGVSSRFEVVLFVCACVFVTLSSALVAPPPASAGSYVVYGCRSPDGSSAKTEGWRPYAFGHPNWSGSTDTCATGGSLRAYLNGAWAQAHNSGEGWSYEAPAGTGIVGARLWRTARTQPDNGYASPVYSLSRDDGGLGSPLEREGCLSNCTLGAGDQPADASNGLTWDTPGARKIQASVACGSAYDYDCSPGQSGAEVRLLRTEVTLDDASSPGIDQVSGALASSKPVHSGVERLIVNAHDVGSGLYRLLAEVDGRVVELARADENAGRCRDANPADPAPYQFVDRVPCKLSDTIALSLDTRPIADGPHVVLVLVEDAAGNRSAAFAAQAFNVQNGPLIRVGVRLRASPGQLRNGRAVRFVGRARSGRLPRGKLVNLQVRLGRRWRTFQVVRVRRDGTFSYRYRFSRSPRGGRFVFRAALPRERGYRFISTASNRVRVRVDAG